jgi:hypothetical protein
MRSIFIAKARTMASENDIAVYAMALLANESAYGARRAS